MTIKLEDVETLELIFAKPTVVNDEIVYVIPQWLVNLRSLVEAQMTS